MVAELMPHQKEAVKRLSNGKVLAGEVGTGKSMVALAYYVENESPKDIYVITTAKKRDSLDWENEAVKFGIGVEEGATVHGVLKVDSWHNIKKYVDVQDAFFIFDEQRLIGSGTWVKSFYKITRKNGNGWIMLSATPGDVWMDYIPLFVANGFYRNPTEFKREHVVYAPFTKYPKIVRYLDVETLEKYRNALIVEMPYLKHTERFFEYVETEYDRDLWDLVFKKRWNPYKDQPIMENGELLYALRRVVNEHPSRIEALKRVMKDRPKIVVFYNFNYELDMLREVGEWKKRTDENFSYGEWNGHRKNPIPSTDSWLYFVQYTSGAEGWNCVETDTMVFFSMTYSYRNLEQAMGRIDRLNTPFSDLYYLSFLTNSPLDKGILSKQQEKKIFNEEIWLSENLEVEV